MHLVPNILVYYIHIIIQILTGVKGLFLQCLLQSHSLIPLVLMSLSPL